MTRVFPRGVTSGDVGRHATQHLSDEQLGALVEVMLVAAMADGEFSDDEKVRFLDFVGSLNDGRLSPTQASGLVLRGAMLLQTEGRDARLAAAKEVLASETAREVSLAMAVNVAAADGLDDAERRQLVEIARVFEVDDATLGELLSSHGAWVEPGR